MELAYKKQNVFLYKFMPCLLFFIVSLMCLFGSYVYADTSVDELVLCNLNGDTLSVYCDMPIIDFSVYPYLLICYTSEFGNSYLNFYYSSSPFVLRDGASDLSYQCVSTVYVYSYTLSGSDVTDFSSCTAESFSTTYQGSSVLSIYSYGFYKTNFDLLDRNGEVVFQAPPQQVEEVGTLGIIAEKTQGVEMNKTLAEIVGILPVILVVIVGLIAIRKGIQFLMARMKRV